ncbi:MAG: hypothetical protein AABX89_06175 [Candidatus Thermoplasmatota archaeon]
MRFWAGLVLGVLLAAVPAASAHPESAAPLLDLRVLAAGHTPEPVVPGAPWSGWLTLRENANITAARFQVCRVGLACFAPPAPAELDGANGFRFNTTNLLVQGPEGRVQVEFQAGWRVGVKWFLTDAAGNTTELPHSACSSATGAACLEDAYLAFTIPEAVRGTPNLGPAALGLLIMALAMVARRMRG